MARPFVPALGYAVNQGFIASVLCINQGRPEMKCDGKRYLKFQLEEQQEQEDAPLDLQVQEEVQPFLSALSPALTPTTAAEKQHAAFLFPAPQQRGPDIFHPPRS